MRAISLSLILTAVVAVDAGAQPTRTENWFCQYDWGGEQKPDIIHYKVDGSQLLRASSDKPELGSPLKLTADNQYEIAAEGSPIDDDAANRDGTAVAAEAVIIDRRTNKAAYVVVSRGTNAARTYLGHCIVVQ
jgi:hypothetical protein